MKIFIDFLFKAVKDVNLQDNDKELQNKIPNDTYSLLFSIDFN